MTDTNRKEEKGKAMKRKIAALVVFIAIAVMSISGTMAYFTAESTATNVITTGSIDIQLVETEKNGNGIEVPFTNDQKGIMPGDSISKIVRVVNSEDAQDAYVRVSVSKTISLAPGLSGQINTDLISCDFNTADWEYKDGYWYYKKPLAPGAFTSPLFEHVTFDTAMGNLYQNCEAKIDVYAQAVQVKHQNVDKATEALGWPTN